MDEIEKYMREVMADRFPIEEWNKQERESIFGVNHARDPSKFQIRIGDKVIIREVARQISTNLKQTDETETNAESMVPADTVLSKKLQQQLYDKCSRMIQAHFGDMAHFFTKEMCSVKELKPGLYDCDIVCVYCKQWKKIYYKSCFVLSNFKKHLALCPNNAEKIVGISTNMGELVPRSSNGIFHNHMIKTEHFEIDE